MSNWTDIAWTEAAVAGSDAKEFRLPAYTYTRSTWSVREVSIGFVGGPRLACPFTDRFGHQGAAERVKLSYETSPSGEWAFACATVEGRYLRDGVAIAELRLVRAYQAVGNIPAWLSALIAKNVPDDPGGIDQVSGPDTADG